MSQFDIAAYLGTYDALASAVQGLTKEQLVWKPAPDKWSVTEVLSHVADHNIVVSFRIRAILAGAQDRLPAFEQDAWVSGSRANEGEAADILALFQSLLAYNAKLFSRLDEEAWNKTGVNFKGETVTLLAAAQGFIKHAHHHVGQIERVKEALAASQGA
ncbi:DinB family protein [Paenibacillus protaetiae]|uniref:DinB family protein n=1 Tax=Paenibacillus protaetiae TaxID=2509456 RepID=A0A4P6EVV7_9BACL|nr:DinB family protein [Paenibacillus protaetiae]QAY67182.1 DinB family protein [Paenibacillus protaetiae]